MQNKPRGRTVILGTGGTIAGTSTDPQDSVGYRAAQIGIEQLVAALPALQGSDLEAEQVAQLDSKDMDFATWQQLARRVVHHLARHEVGGIVVTHGTDTLEETAYFLQRLLAPGKPVVLTGAMRPATALLPDGPQNLLDAVRVAQLPGAHGVVAVLAGSVHSAFDVRKVHTRRLDAFGSGDAGPLGRVEPASVRLFKPWPRGPVAGRAALETDPAAWPRVEIVTSHAGAGSRLVDALLAHGVAGLVVAGTGNGSVHHTLEQALYRAQQQGVAVLRSTRCADGPLVDPPSGPGDALPAARGLTPVQARIELMLELLGPG